MNAGRGRQRAYSDLLTGLIDLGPTTAADRFDELLEQARAEGRIDDDTARVLRWWQREAVRAQGDHLLTTAPALLAALDEAQSDAIDSAAAAESAWTTAASTPAATDDASIAAAPFSPAPSPVAAPTAAPAPPLAPAPPAAPTPTTSGARHAAPPKEPAASAAPVASAPTGDGIPGLDVLTDTPLFDQVAAVHEPEPPNPDELVMAVPAVAQAPATDASPAATPLASLADDGSVIPTSDWPVPRVLNLAAPARRRRLLVAGLTVIDDGNTLPSIADPP